jgi:hypothetical protein
VDKIEQIIAPLQSEAERLERQKSELQSQIRDINDDLKRINRILLASQRDQTVKGKIKPRPTFMKLSPTRVNDTLAAIKEHAPDQPFTRMEVVEWTNQNQKTVGDILRDLRRTEAIRLVGRAPYTEGTKGLTPYVYRVMNASK